MYTVYMYVLCCAYMYMYIYAIHVHVLYVPGLQAFLYCVVYEAQWRHQAASRGVLPEPGQPAVLPVLLCEQLVTSQQQQWWSTAYKLCHNQAR